MNNKTIIPAWISEGPMDFEFKSYKMFSELEELSAQLASGKLFYVLNQVDETLDYLYKYDGDRLTGGNGLADYELVGVDWENFNLQFVESDETLERDAVLDELNDLAIDKFEALHAKIRTIWRDIESGVQINYVPRKPYFVASGFVFIITPDNIIHTYYFNKPTKYFTTSWKFFELQHMQSNKFTEELYFKQVEELVSNENDTIIFKVRCEKNIKVENNAIAIIQHKIYNRLKQDFSF